MSIDKIHRASYTFNQKQNNRKMINMVQFAYFLCIVQFIFVIYMIYFFNPAIAPSSLSKCPKNLSDYYKNNNCLMGLSLAGQSILIFLLDKENNKVLSVEKIFIGKRLRHFGVK